MPMTELERMVREILARNVVYGSAAILTGEKADVFVSEAVNAIKDAITKAPPGWKLVPIIPAEDMSDAGRSAVMARDCSGPNWGAGDHYRAAGLSTEGIDPRLLKGKGFMTKGHCADLVWQAMLSAAPEYKEGE